MVSDFDEKKLKREFRRFYISPHRLSRSGEEWHATLDKLSAHHIRTVLRLQSGAQIILFDGTGKEYLAEIILSKPEHIKAKILETRFPQTESFLEITLAQALIKENSFDKVLSSATELGVKKIIPVLTKRVVVNLQKKNLEQKMLRWRKILEESSALSRRVKVPQMEYPLELEKLLAQNFEAIKIILWEKAKAGGIEQLRSQNPEIKKQILLLVGPEGGFEEQEVEKALSAGFIPLWLGPRILRAETAPLASLALLQYLFGDLGRL